MKATMNPLDLLAEVAVTCTDDESGDKLENCDDCSNSDTESGEQECGSESELVIKPSTITNNNNSIELPLKTDCVTISNDIEGDNSEPSCELPIKSETGMAVVSNGSANSNDRQAACSAAESVEMDKTSSATKCTCPKINNTVVCGSLCSRKMTEFSSQKHPTDLMPLKKEDIKHADLEHTYPSRKPPVDDVSTPTTATSPAESLAQRVTRLLSPNFKLTMTDTIPSVLQSRHFSSLLIGNVGSTTMRTALSQGAHVFPHPVTVKPRGHMSRKYPNISMSTIPSEHPLLDHDYCYQNYYELVQAAAKLVKERNAKKKASAKQERASEECQPMKRKYRTKRVIAAEAEQRALLMQRLLDGDETAQEKLDELDRLQREREMKASKKHKKKREEVPSVEVEADSDEEAVNEFTEDVDRENPVIDHDSTFKDQFVYFGSKKYQSRSRRLNKGKGPYELFWTTGQLKSDTSKVQLGSKQDQEIDDVLDILGISPRQSVDDSTASPGSPADSSNDGVSNASSLVNDRCAVESIVSSDRLTTNNETMNVEQQASKTDGTPAANVSLGVGLDDLLQGITVDQVSELIQALNAEPSLETVGIVTDTVSQKALTVETVQSVPSLSAIARDICLANSIDIPAPEENQCLSQQYNTSNLSLDFPDADLLTSEKHIDLDLLEKLSATPPRPTRPTSLFSPKASDDESVASAEQAFKATCNAPVVVPVTMYWNTFPALLLDGVKYIRLIDISRQALPSKETGLLKKRAQSLGYEVITCTDLQRSLLVKYAFACPSRSNLMVSEAAAAEVMASYMEKSEIEELSKAPKLVGQAKTGSLPAAETTARKANAEPVTLMPQVLVEHEPLQQSSAGSGKKTSAGGAEPTAPERSSRLRQLTSSYRRFLPRSTSIANAASPKESSGSSNSTQEENASDRGYHSDQSPDSVHARRVSVKKNKIKERKEKQKNSVRRSLSSTDKHCANMSADMSLPKLPVEERLVEVDEHPPPSPSLCSPTGVSDVSAGGISADIASSTLKHQVPSALCEPMLSVMTKSEIVHIRHMDFTPKRNGKKVYQDGDLFLEFFKSLRSPCIQCCTCRQFYTVRSFSKHQHINRKLATVKNRQRTEPRGASVGSPSWQIFQKRKQRLESNRAPLTKLTDTCLTKSAPVSTDGRHVKLFPSSPQKLGKRIPKQKKCNPDEVYYSNPCIKNTSRKRQAEADAKAGKKRVRLSAGDTSLNEHVDR